MSSASKRPCTHPGCGVLTETGRCAKHPPSVRGKDYDRKRGGSTERLYDSRWQKAREGFLRSHPLCMCPDCDAGRLRVRAAVVVDHKIPHRGDKQLFWDRNNWQSMAKDCHDKKTATEDGGFGNTPRGGVDRNLTSFLG